MLGIPSPPQPQLPIGTALAVAAGCIVVGGLLLVWGRLLARSFLALAGAGAGALLAGWLAGQFRLDTAVASVIAIVGFAIVAALAARIIWPIVGGGLFASVGLCALLCYGLPGLTATTQPVFGPAETWEQWGGEAWRFAQQGMSGVWADRPTWIVWTLCLAGGIPLVALLLLPQMGKIFMTAVVGSLALAVGLLLALGSLTPLAWPVQWSGYTVYGIIALVLFVFSLVLQSCGAAAARRAAKAKKEKQAAAKQGGKSSGEGKGRR